MASRKTEVCAAQQVKIRLIVIFVAEMDLQTYHTGLIFSNSPDKTIFLCETGIPYCIQDYIRGSLQCPQALTFYHYAWLFLVCFIIMTTAFTIRVRTIKDYGFINNKTKDKKVTPVLQMINDYLMIIFLSYISKS